MLVFKYANLKRESQSGQEFCASEGSKKVDRGRQNLISSCEKGPSTDIQLNLDSDIELEIYVDLNLKFQFCVPAAKRN